MMKWSNLTMRERSDLMGLFLKHGIGSLSDMRRIYDEGGDMEPAVITAEYPRNKEVLDIVNSSNANWVRRLKAPDRQYIQDWEDSNSIATHKLSWAEDNGKYYIYPNVQEINGRLYDFTNERKYGKNGWRALDSAIYSGDIVEVPSSADARWFTENYKNFYPTFNKYPDGGELKPATITERIGRKWDNFYWQRLRKPKDYSDEVADTPECAAWSNRELRKKGYNIWGDAWTRSNQRVKKVFSGYDGMEKPEEYSYGAYKDYVLGAADNVKRNFDWRDLEENDIVGLYFRGSPNYQKAFNEGSNGEAQTHTGHVIYRKGKPYIVHNVHGDIVMNKAKRLMGRRHPYGIVSVYRPYDFGGMLNF